MKHSDIFIVDKEDLENKKKQLKEVSFDNETFTTNYLDESDGSEWKEYQVNSEYFEEGIPILIKIPEPDQKELIQMALSGDSHEEIAAASIFLFCNERDKNLDFREDLLTELEHFASKSKEAGENTMNNKNKLKIIIYESCLYDGSNIRPVLNKHYTEVEKDFQFFQRTAARSKAILEDFENQ